MAFFQGLLPVRWSMSEVESLPYFYESFNDPATSAYWNDIWGYQFRTGLQADFRSPQPPWTQQVVQDLAEQGWPLSNVGTSFYVMRPGDILPRHRDTYSRYCAYHGLSPNVIWRAIVFMQAWHPGFLFEIDDQAVTGYAAGHFVIWHNDSPHMAGNVGCLPRYTLQITGTKKN